MLDSEINMDHIESTIKGLNAIKAFLERSEFTGLEIQTKNQIDFLTDAISSMEKYKEQTRHFIALKNRCAVLTKGLLCEFCPIECGSREKEYREQKDDKD